MPAGYRDAPQLLAPKLFAGACSEILEDAVTLCKMQLVRPIAGFDLFSLFPFRPSIDWRFCPIHIVQDGTRLGIPNTWLLPITSISEIEEPERFLRQLRALDVTVQRRWQLCKEKLSTSVSLNGFDFKPWPKEGRSVFSVRIDRGYRAHLRLTHLTRDGGAIP